MSFLYRVTPWVLQVLSPLFFPPSRRRRSSFLAAQTLALIEFVSWCWDSTIHKPSMPRSCVILAAPSLPNFMLLAFHSTINLLLSMEMSRSWWGNPPLAWANHFSAISPWWTWYPSTNAQWNEVGVIPMASESVWDEDLSLASGSVLDWALQGWRHSAFSPC